MTEEDRRECEAVKAKAIELKARMQRVLASVAPPPKERAG